MWCFTVQANILLDGTLHPLLCNFGSTSYEGDASIRTITHPAFVAPERLTRGSTSPASKESDVYLFGSLLYEVRCLACDICVHI